MAAVTTTSAGEGAIKIQICDCLRDPFATLRTKQGDVTVFGHGCWFKVKCAWRPVMRRDLRAAYALHDFA